MAERERLKAQERAKLVVPHGTNHHQVLMADAVHAFAVEAGLVGDNHAGLQGLGVEVLAHILRAFVRRKEEAHAVAGTVTKVALGPPERFAGQGVYLASGRSAREQGHGQADVPLQYQRVVFPLQRRAGAEGYRAGDVRGAKQVLPAGVYQIQAVRFQESRPRMRRDIVRKGCGRPVSRYGFKTVFPVTGHLRAEPAQFQGSLPLIHGADMARNPVQELLHDKAILQMRFPHALYLDRVLHGLPERNRRGNLPHFRQQVSVLNGIPERVIHLRRVQTDAVYPVQPKSCQIEVDIIVIPNGNTIGLQFFETGGGLRIRVLESILAHIPENIVQGNEKIRDNNGSVLDVLSPHVEKPRNLIQSRNEDGIGPLKHQPLAKASQASFAALPHQVLTQRDDGRDRDGGAVGPQRRQDIRHRDNPGRWHRLLQRIHRLNALAQAVHGNDRFVQP